MNSFVCFRPAMGELPVINIPSRRNTIDLISINDKNSLSGLSRGLCLEVGTYLGGSAQAILWGRADHLVCVDTFRGSRGEMDTGVVSPDVALSVLNMRLEMFGVDKWSVFQTSSLAASCLFRDDLFDFIFIDGDHSEQAFRNDIIVWWPKLKCGGIMCGHDYDSEPDDPNPSGAFHPQVAKVIYEAFERGSVRKHPDCIWSIVKSAS